MHEFTDKYASKSAQPISRVPSQLPACRLHPLLYVLELRLLSMSHWLTIWTQDPGIVGQYPL